MIGRGPDERKSMMVQEPISVPINRRDASSTSTPLWKNPPTPISVPAVDGRAERLRRPQDNSCMRATNLLALDTGADGRPQGLPRGHGNPYFRMSSSSGLQKHRPGNPNVRQTILAKPPDGFGVGAGSRARKRQKLDPSIGPTITPNAAVLSPYASAPVPRSGVPEPDIQVIEPPRGTNNRNNHVPDDSEIIDLGASDDDLGERVLPTVKSSSPDELLLTGGTGHPFETRPTEYNSSNKGKSVAKQPLEIVEGSEEEDEIEEFTPPPFGQPFNARKSREIPMNIVHERKKLFERAPLPAPAATRQPIENVKSINLITQKVIGKMKKKDESAIGHQRCTVVSDVGTSSSNFVNSAREKENKQVLPLIALCFGHHSFEDSESTHLKLTYEVNLQRIGVTWGRSPPEKIEFKLGRDVSSAMIVNDLDEPLRENVVIQFKTTRGDVWREAERKYKGFTGGGERGREALTLLFSIGKDRGLTATDYRKFVVGIKNALPSSAVETIKPSKGGSVWGFALRAAAMFEQRESRNGKDDRSQNDLDKPSALTRSVTPCSSTSIKTGPEPKFSNGDSGPSISISRRRSARQSALQTLRASPPPPHPAHLEPDEVVLLYPPTGTGALSITHSDIRRLQPEEYLNDTLIEFGLKLWLDDLRRKDPALADQIYVFSSFFYKKLNNRKKFDETLRVVCHFLINHLIYSPEDGYQSVRKWTSRADIFTKKYVIVPINENIHWYLAIIYEPGHTLEPPLLSSQLSSARMTRKRKHARDRGKANSETLTEVSLERPGPAVHLNEGEPEVDTSFIDATRATTPSATEYERMNKVFDKSCFIAADEPTSEIQIRDLSPNLMHPPSDCMDIDVDTSVTGDVPNLTCGVAEVPESSTPKLSLSVPVSQFYGSVRRPGDMEASVFMDNEDSGEDQQQEAEVDDMLAVSQPSAWESPSQTHIFTLDSLGTRHPQAIKVLKQYLASEAKDKRNFDEVRDAVGKQVQVPVQPNTWDCGIYLLHFVKIFMNSPAEFVEKILSTRGTIPSSERKKMWQDHEIPQSRDYLKSRIIQLSEEWKAKKTFQEEDASKRGSGNAAEVDALSSGDEVDIVEDNKASPGPKQKRPAARLRG